MSSRRSKLPCNPSFEVGYKVLAMVSISVWTYQGERLTQRTEEEANEFRQIRLACLPELVVAYNSILNYSAYFAGRDVLKTSMDLAALVAEEGSDLAACLMETGRMPELVDSFAIVAKSMIAAEAKRPGEKQKDGKTLGLFSAKRAAGANEA